MARVTVGTTATQLDAPAARGFRASSVLVRCPAADIHIEFTQAAATTVDGFTVPAGTSIEVPLTADQQLWAVAGTAGTVVHVLRSA